MKKILGLDLGTNSIGWAVVNGEMDNHGNMQMKDIAAAGSRIIPMDAAQLGNFDNGISVSQTKERTHYRTMRRLFQRRALRRERLLRVLNIMGFLPKHFDTALTRYGKLKEEVLLPWIKTEDGKRHFLFQESFEEMISDFRQAGALPLDGKKKIPYDWTIYYLRKKALTQPIKPQELAWLLLQFNQKRGYHLLRSQEEDVKQKENKQEELVSLRVKSITKAEADKNNQHWYEILLENGLIYRRSFRTQPDWVGSVRDFIITTTTLKNGEKKQSISSPKPDDWALLKKKTEKGLSNSGQEVGEYIYNTLLHQPQQKIIGQFVRTIDRKFYKQELERIIDTQMQFLPELRDKQLYTQCIYELYPSNKAYRESIAEKNFSYLLVDDILFYQRPLRSKKSQIDTCNYESHTYKDKEGNQHQAGVKCIAKSHPLYQEFRLWQFIHNLRIFQLESNINGHFVLDHDVTETLIPNEESRAHIFEVLSCESEINEKGFFHKCLGIKSGKTNPLKYRWNYAREEEKKYPCNQTRHTLLIALKNAGVSSQFLSNEKELELWHILYSIDDKEQLKRTLQRYAERNSLPQSFIEEMSKVPAFKKDYGAYSAKALKKLLPLMRLGKYWNEQDIDETTRARINHIIDAEADDNISMHTREQLMNITDISQCRGMALHKACYLVYDRHSEQANAQYWTKPQDIDTFLKNFKQHSLRNPIVEQVITETLRTVRDIWKQEGHIDEIHLEMGRNLKQTSQERNEATKRNTQNEIRNCRIMAMLNEFSKPEHQIEGVKPYSPTQQSLLRIYEEGALNELNEQDQEFQFVTEISKISLPTTAQIMRYRQWLDQKYFSPYTHEPIPLSRLFTTDYEIEHIIPRSRFFDDSFQNKVICEAAVNKLKDNLTGMEFIRKYGGQVVQLGNGKSTCILNEEAYTKHVSKTFAHNRAKMQRMLMDDIPDTFIERQMNDSRYIACYVKSLLSNIVRDEDESNLSISRNLITTNGSITTILKKDWGVNDVWKRMLLPRFIRLEKLPAAGGLAFTAKDKGHDIPTIPLELQKGQLMKRIDHRHHAMDAIVIACTTRNHVNLLNNEAAKSGNATLRQQLSHKLRSYKTISINGKQRQVPETFLKPWDTFTTDTEHILKQIIVSFKQKQRIINRTQNKYTRYIDGKKQNVLQTKGDQWAIRKPMHKETVYGEVTLQFREKVKLKEALKQIPNITHAEFRKELLTQAELYNYKEKAIKSYFQHHKDEWAEINLEAIEVCYSTKDGKERYFATRKMLDTSFDEKEICKITDTGIQKILRAHLTYHNNRPEMAFSPEGIEEMNRNISMLNDGKKHQPIRKVRIYEMANKFAVGQQGNKHKKFVEAAKNTNLYFAIYEYPDNKKTAQPTLKRNFYSIPLREAIERSKQGLKIAPCDDQGREATFVLSPGVLVYLPTEIQRGKKLNIQDIQHDRIYKMVSCTGNACHFVPMTVATPIYNKVEFEAKNKMERALTGEMIKENCLPLTVDRIGNITAIINSPTAE